MSQRPAPPPEPTTVLHPFAVLAEPALGSAAVALVMTGERIAPLRREAGFLVISYGADRVGYLPAAVCAPLGLGAPGSLAPLEIAQPVTLYRAPLPGGQFVVDPSDERQPWLLQPDEPLWLLGQDDRFVLAQRADGAVGYVPTAVCGPSSHIVAGGLLSPLNLGWLIVGAGWSLLNWLALDRALAQQVWADLVPRVYLGLWLSIVLSLVLWLRGSPYMLARAFALGILLGYWLAHGWSGGQMIL